MLDHTIPSLENIVSMQGFRAGLPSPGFLWLELEKLPLEVSLAFHLVRSKRIVFFINLSICITGLGEFLGLFADSFFLHLFNIQIYIFIYICCKYQIYVSDIGVNS